MDLQHDGSPETVDPPRVRKPQPIDMAECVSYLCDENSRKLRRIGLKSFGDARKRSLPERQCHLMLNSLCPAL
jgi:hypothetical protein